jgi:cytoskeletal protein RodZ
VIIAEEEAPEPPAVTPAKPRRKGRGCLWLVAVLLLILLGLGGWYFFLGGEGKVSEQLAVYSGQWRATPTVTRQPTDEPTATNTPTIAPTETAVPTATAEPGATAKPTATTEPTVEPIIQTATRQRSLPPVHPPKRQLSRLRLPHAAPHRNAGERRGGHGGDSGEHVPDGGGG